MEIGVLAASAHAGKPLAEVFPHFAFLEAPDLVKAEDADWCGCDAVFSGLPHGTAQDLIKQLPRHLKVIDMSADFRLRDADVYAQWYGRTHEAPDLLADAVYGLTEHYRRGDRGRRGSSPVPAAIRRRRCSSLLPLVAAGLIDAGDIIIDAKSGITGAGRGLKQNLLLARGRRGPVALQHRQPSPRARDRAGNRQGRGPARCW